MIDIGHDKPLTLEEELEEIRSSITGLGLEIDHAIKKAYRQGFKDGFDLGSTTIEDDD